MMSTFLFVLLLVALLLPCVAANNAAMWNITLFGDSLINLPSSNFNLLELIQTQLVFGQATVYNSGINGNRIANMLARVDDMLTSTSPSAVILFWDSDCSDVDESTMSSEQVAELRANYTQNLIATCERIFAYPTVTHLAIAGPEVLGEGPIGTPDRFKNKTQMLDDYREINKQVASSFANVPYIDVRQAFLDAIAEKDWKFYSLYTTVDGEHPNQRGTTIEADLFAQQINAWMRL